MNIFLFLYPIIPYMDFLVKEYDYPFKRKRCDVNWLNNIIEKRYRSKKFQIAWVYFSENGKVSPDITMHYGLIKKKTDDLNINAGLSFMRHMQEKIYSDPACIIGQLPQPIENLVVGGFHRSDCVDRVAEYAHKKGISVAVDEDTTEFFFVITSLHGKIPLRRNTRFLPKYLIRFAYDKAGGKSLILEHIKKHREERPWLAQIRL